MSKRKQKTERKTLTDELDDLARQCTWHRDAFTCQKCGKGPSKQAHHAFNRIYKGDGVRWDLRNLVNLCWPCHRYWAEVKHEEFRRWYISKYAGETTWEELSRMALQGRPLTNGEMVALKETLTDELNRLKKGSNHEGKLR